MGGLGKDYVGLNENLTMNTIEKLIMNIGRLRGAYIKGVSGVDAPLADNTAWNTGRYWGTGITGQRPEDNPLAYFSSWVYIASMLNAKTCASVPLRLYVAKSEKGKAMKWAGTAELVPVRPVAKARLKEFNADKSLQHWMTKAVEVEEVTEHPFLDLMQSVNPFSNLSDLMELTVIFMDLTGSAYWYLIKNKLAAPSQIWIIPAQYMTPIPGKTLDKFIEGYRFERGTTKTILPVEDVLQFSYPNPKNQLIGFSPVEGVADAIYNNSKMNEYEQAVFENKARTGGVFETDMTVPPAAVERVKEQWKQDYTSMRKAGKSPILPPGIKWVKDSMTSEEISFIEGRKLTREEICAGLDVPISLMDPNSIRANAENAEYFHAKYGITPRLRKIMERLNERLMPLYGPSLFCAFDNVIPEDKQFELDARVRSTGVPFETINEARAEVGKDPVEGGDMPMIPFSSSPLGAEETDTDVMAEELAAKTKERLKELLA